MKRSVSLIMIAVLMLMLCACGAVPPQGAVYTAVNDPEAAAETETPAPPASPAATPAVQDEYLMSVLEEFYNDYHPGVAGSSLRLTGIAAKVLDWYTVFGDDAVAETTAADFAAQYDVYAGEEAGEGASDIFADRMVALRSMALELCSAESNEAVADSGYTPQCEKWSAEDADACFRSLFTGMGLEMPEQ